MVTRRRFIGLVGIGCLSAAFVGMRIHQPQAPLVSALKFKHLSSRHASILVSVFSTVLAVADGPTLERALQKADRLLDHFDSWARLELMGALELLEQSPLWSIGSLKKFSVLSPQDKIQVLKNWSTGPKRARPLVQGLKEFSVFVYYSQDQSWSEIGYEGPLVGRS